MTEAEWRVCADPDQMLEILAGTATDRKLRWFTSACCRRLWQHISAPCSRHVVELIEQVADGAPLEAGLAAASQEAMAFAESPEGSSSETVCSAAFMAADAVPHYPGELLIYVATRTVGTAGNTSYWSAREMTDPSDYPVVMRDDLTGETHRVAEAAAQSALLRDIFGNPFRPVAFEAAWRTSDVMLLAQGIYDAKAFDRMPILADALQDAGCNNTDVLDHCRNSDAPHVRGCWAVDLVLGKE